MFVFGTVIKYRVAGACKTAFGAVQNMSNYGIFCRTFLCICCDSSGKDGLIFVYIWYNNHVPCIAVACKLALGPVPN